MKSAAIIAIIMAVTMGGCSAFKDFFGDTPEQQRQELMALVEAVMETANSPDKTGDASSENKDKMVVLIKEFIASQSGKSSDNPITKTPYGALGAAGASILIAGIEFFRRRKATKGLKERETVLSAVISAIENSPDIKAVLGPKVKQHMKDLERISGVSEEKQRAIVRALKAK